jgi:hypothetical protein
LSGYWPLKKGSAAWSYKLIIFYLKVDLLEQMTIEFEAPMSLVLPTGQE